MTIKTILASLAVGSALITNPISVSPFYPTTGIVTEVDEANDLVVYTDYPSYTNEWDFKGTEDWSKGDVIALIMDSKGTVSIYDDEPIQVRYCGHLE